MYRSLEPSEAVVAMPFMIPVRGDEWAFARVLIQRSFGEIP